MKLLITFMAMITLIQFGAQAGPIAGGGPRGQELLFCSGVLPTIPDGAFTVSVSVRMDIGIAANIVFISGNYAPILLSVDPFNDARGYGYHGNDFSILIPAMQGTDIPAPMRAIMSSGAMTQNQGILLSCP